MRGSPDGQGVNGQVHGLLSLPHRGYRLQLLRGQEASISEVDLIAPWKASGHISRLERGSLAQIQPTATTRKHRQMIPALLFQEKQEIPIVT